MSYEYKGYSIDYNFYGQDEYTVQYCGDDLMFESKESAEQFIDEITNTNTKESTKMTRTEELMNFKGVELIKLAMEYGLTVSANKEKTQLKESKKKVVEKIVNHEEAMRAEDEAATMAEYAEEMKAEEFNAFADEIMAEIRATVAEPEEEEIKEFVENIVEAKEPTRTINDYIYRSLPKYVQKVIDYCDYVDGVYRIHVSTDFGSKEVASRRWDDASKEVRTFCKSGK